MASRVLYRVPGRPEPDKPMLGLPDRRTLTPPLPPCCFCFSSLSRGAWGSQCHSTPNNVFDTRRSVCPAFLTFRPASFPSPEKPHRAQTSGWSSSRDGRVFPDVHSGRTLSLRVGHLWARAFPHPSEAVFPVCPAPMSAGDTPAVRITEPRLWGAPQEDRSGCLVSSGTDTVEDTPGPRLGVLGRTGHVRRPVSAGE